MKGLPLEGEKSVILMGIEARKEEDKTRGAMGVAVAFGMLGLSALFGTW